MWRFGLTYLCAALASAGLVPRNGDEQAPAPAPGAGDGGATFTNPILNKGADPWVIQRDGWYCEFFVNGEPDGMDEC